MTTEPDGTAWARTLHFAPMTVEAALTIADTWKYPAPYDFYDATADAEDYAEFTTPARWPQWFWQVRQDDELVGFLTAEPADDGACEISLGLRPDLTGCGRGRPFLQAGLALLDAHAGPRRVVLSVAAFNRRAISVYESVGFRTVRTYAQPTNGAIHDFVEMELHRGHEPADALRCASRASGPGHP